MALCSRWFVAGFLVFTQLFMLNAQAHARVYISNEARFQLPIEQRLEVQPGQYVRIAIPVKAPALLDVTVSVQNATFNDLSAYVCDETSFQRFSQRLTNNCQGINKGRGNFSFRYSLQSPQRYYLVLDNSHALLVIKKAIVQIIATVRLPPEDVSELRTGFENLQKGLSEIFGVPEFDISLMSCGQVNAFSTNRGGNITLCSELLFGLLAEGLEGASEAILLHELSHTLLNLWGLPNWDNEETADELAVVILL